MINLTLYTKFVKRRNSTKIPEDGFHGDSVKVTLKDSTSIHNPTFLLNASGDFLSSHLYTYLKWIELNRYYFIDDVIQISNNLFAIKCSFDPMGTHKNLILKSSQFVTFSKSKGNENIIDSRLVPKATPTCKHNTGISVLPNENTCVVVNIINQNGDSAKVSGGIGQYIFPNTSAFSSFLQSVFHMYDSTDMEEVYKMYMAGTTPDSVLSANWYPYTPSSTSDSTVYVGGYETNIGAKILNNATETTSQSLIIPWNDFPIDVKSRCSTYCKAWLYLPYIGVIGLNIEDIAASSALGIDYTFDNVNGAFSCIVRNGSEILYSYNGSVSASIQFSTMTNNPVGALMDFGSGLGNAISLNVGGALSDLINGVGELTRADTCTMGNYNTRLSSVAYADEPMITIHYYEPQIDSSLYDFAGHIYCKQDTINEFQGFVQTQNANFRNVVANVYENELSEICSYMDNGFYVE